jgi:hypothetical protein
MMGLPVRVMATSEMARRCTTLNAILCVDRTAVVGRETTILANFGGCEKSVCPFNWRQNLAIDE